MSSSGAGSRGGKGTSLGRTDRINNRIAATVEGDSGGRFTVCAICGQVFEQVWRPQYNNYTSFKTCGRCRMRGARGDDRETITYEPHPGQQLVHDSPARFRLIAAGARWGKDRCCVMEFIKRFTEMLSEDRGPEMVPVVHGWIIAPTFTMARQNWRELKTYFPRRWTVNYWEADKMLETINGGLIEVRSADDPDALVGVGLDIVLVTEAARISKLEEVWANLETRLMSPGRGPGGMGGLALINSTPKGRNYYHTMFRWGQKDDPLYDPDWESWQQPSWSNPYLRVKDRQELQRMKKRYPERVYKQEIEAVFLAEGNSVFATCDECAIYTGPSEPQPNESYVIGYDPARSADYSGVVIRNSLGQTVRVEQWSGKNWELQISEIAFLSRSYNYAPVIVDKTGLGETLPEALTKSGVYVEAVHFTNQEKERMVNNLALLIEQKAIVYPDHPALLGELRDYEYTMTKTGLIRYAASSSTKHDDLVTALMLSYKDYATIEMGLPFVGLFSGLSIQR